MGCDIHSFAEVKRKKKWEKVEEKIFPGYGNKKTSEPFGWRDYSIFAFLAGVRNYDYCEPLSDPKGFPKDSEFLNSKPEKQDFFEGGFLTHGQEIQESWSYHSLSHLTLKELLDFDYEKIFWNRRVTKQISENAWTGAGVAKEGEGKMISYRENLGESFFETLEVLKTLGEPEDVRIIFWFDS